MYLMVSKVVGGEWSRAIGVDKNRVKLGKHGMSIEVPEGFSHKGVTIAVML